MSGVWGNVCQPVGERHKDLSPALQADRPYFRAAMPKSWALAPIQGWRVADGRASVVEPALQIVLNQLCELLA